MSSIFPIVLILGGIAGFALANPVWNDVSALRSERAELSSIMSSIEDSRNRKDDLMKELAAIPADKRARLGLMIPEESRREGILLMMTNIARKNGVEIKTISFTESRAVVEGDFASVDTALTVSGNYPNLIAFTKDVESALRLSDIERVAITSSGKSPFDLQLTVRSYYVEKRITE